MNDKKKHDQVLHGAEGQINYRDFGRRADMADKAETPEEFEESILEEQVEHLKKFVVKRNDIKGRGSDYTDEEKTTIATGTVQNEFRKRTGMSVQEFFANVKADSAAASA
jgi:hypothetical protein